MPAPYLFVVSMDVDADKEALFNEVYDDEHVPLLLKVPGVLGATRYKREAFKVNIGGEVKSVDDDAAPNYTAIYEIESPEVLISTGWVSAVEAGRWPEMVRPYTKNRQHNLVKNI